VESPVLCSAFDNILLAPMLWGTFSDRWGRRPMFIGCMISLALSCVGLALVPTSEYWLLMVLRCLQAFGSASTIALGMCLCVFLTGRLAHSYQAGGVIGDISTTAERGGFFGFFSVGPMIGPSIGPIIGGSLAQAFGWRLITAFSFYIDFSY
jgi:MFS family permease